MGLLTSLLNIFRSSQGSTSETSPAAEEEYKGFIIIARPAAEGSQYRVNGLIRKREDQGVREHIFIRADVLPTQELCTQETFRKAKLMIDQQGDNIFH
ncbi:HlyU family transcriptional regulator [Neptunomonas qingdaonensis]|uniref:Transcriptional activator HlyU n=1 Tax=Neptunomonas qingdaonensis TaxID=1045558 RepID=A0A1I2QWN5_9GAMM|nr:HlyU family transcriptional regulator [Neptunomonas qingdaonensis]SFG31659.1 hypothetical protein SAMN05216175_105143 [Neptunomonas qingdaonensis]